MDSETRECGIQTTKLQEISFGLSKARNSKISQDGKTLFILNTDEITSYQTATLQKVDHYNLSGLEIIEISPNGKIALVNLHDGNLALWDLATKTQKSVLKVPEYHDEDMVMAFSPDGSEIAGSWGACEYGGNVAVWDVNTGKLIWHKQNGVCAGNGIAYSPDGKTIVSGISYSRSIFLWNAHNGDVQEVFSEKQPEWVSSVIFSRSGKLLAFGTGHVGEGVLLAPVIIVDTSNNTMIHILDGKQDTIHSITISPNDKIIAAGTGDGSIVLWDIKTGNHLCTLNVGKSNIDVFFTQDDSFVSVQQDGTLSLWALGK